LKFWHAKRYIPETKVLIRFISEKSSFDKETYIKIILTYNPKDPKSKTTTEYISKFSGTTIEHFLKF